MRRRACTANWNIASVGTYSGRIGHVEEGMWRDRKRDNAHAVVGWLTLRFGWWEVVNSPCAVAADIAAVLRARGWTGLIRACANCGEVRTA